MTFEHPTDELLERAARRTATDRATAVFGRMRLTRGAVPSCNVSICAAQTANPRQAQAAQCADWPAPITVPNDWDGDRRFGTVAIRTSGHRLRLLNRRCRR